jgi:integrase
MPLPGTSPNLGKITLVSLMSDSGVPVEEIARRAGHANSRTTELVYRHQLKPMIENGTKAMDQLFNGAD